MERETRMKFEPMLAATMTDPWLKQLVFPVLASVKLDGYRCVVKDGRPVSRNLKPIPNQHIFISLSTPVLEGLDGELIVGSPIAPDCLSKTSSGVKKATGIPQFKFHVFDDFSVHGHDFHYRLGHAEDRVTDIGDKRVSYVEHTLIHSIVGLLEFERTALAAGYEGVMIRDPKARYKFGRATELESSMWKLKRFKDGEFLITRVLQGQANQNAPVKDELGRTKRATLKEHMMPNGLVGTILGEDIETGEPVRASPGKLTLPERELYWRQPELLIGQIGKYKAFEYGAKDVDRFVTFQCLRSPDDMALDGNVRAVATL